MLGVEVVLLDGRVRRFGGPAGGRGPWREDWKRFMIGSEGTRPKIELEMTLLMWRNHFTCDILAENGTAHIESLCKWGPSRFTVRTRILPSGRPPEESVTLVQDDPTWALEYAHFRTACLEGRRTDLSTDAWLNRTLRTLGDRAIEASA